MKLLPFVQIISFLLLFTLWGCNNSPKQEGNFTDWDYSPKGVYGIVEIQNPTGRVHFRIKKASDNLTTIEEVNTLGKVVNTINVVFANGKLSSYTDTDQWGQVIETRVFDQINDEEVIVKISANGVNNCAPCNAYKRKYDGFLGIEIQYTWFDGKPCTNESGISLIKYEKYNDTKKFGLNKSYNFFDEELKPSVSPGWGCHKVLREFDDNGNLKKESRYDLAGNLTKGIHGVYESFSEYDSMGNEIKERNNFSIYLNYNVIKILDM